MNRISAKKFCLPKTVLWDVFPDTLANIVTKLALNFLISTKNLHFTFSKTIHKQ